MSKKSKDENEEFKKCIYCTEWKKGRCRLPSCVYLLERAELKAATYKDFVKDSFSFSEHFYLKKRLKQLIKSFTGEWFLSSYHKARFWHYSESSALFQKKKNIYLGVIYILSSDDELWKKVNGHIGRKDIDFESINIKGISTDGYALYHTAKAIYNDEYCLDESELADDDLIKNYIFKAIINGILIAKYGKPIITILNKGD